MGQIHLPLSLVLDYFKDFYRVTEDAGLIVHTGELSFAGMNRPSSTWDCQKMDHSIYPLFAGLKLSPTILDTRVGNISYRTLHLGLNPFPCPLSFPSRRHPQVPHPCFLPQPWRNIIFTLIPTHTRLMFPPWQLTQLLHLLLGKLPQQNEGKLQQEKNRIPFKTPLSHPTLGLEQLAKWKTETDSTVTLPVRATGPPDGDWRQFYTHLPFASNDLYNWKLQNPTFSEKPSKCIDLLDFVMLTHQPTWDDYQQLYYRLLKNWF